MPPVGRNCETRARTRTGQGLPMNPVCSPLGHAQRQRPETPPEPPANAPAALPHLAPIPKSPDASTRFWTVPGKRTLTRGGDHWRSLQQGDDAPQIVMPFLSAVISSLPAPGAAPPLASETAETSQSLPLGDRISDACRPLHGDILWKSCEFSRAIRRVQARAIRRITLVPSGARTPLQATSGGAYSSP